MRNSSVNCSLRLRHFAMNISEEPRERRENVNIPTRDETSVNTRQGDKQENEALPDHMLVDASQLAAQSAEGGRSMRAVRFDTERQNGRLCASTEGRRRLGVSESSLA